MAKLELFLPAQFEEENLKVGAALVARYGGFSAASLYGEWMNKDGKIIRDSIKKITVYHEGLINEGWLHDLLMQYKKDTGEECILYSLDPLYDKFTFL